MKPKINTKVIKIIAVLACVGLLAAGCGSSTTGPALPSTLNIWLPFDDNESFNILADLYRAKNSKVEITVTRKNFETYEADLLDALASGQGPDIFSIHNTWLPKYINKTEPAPIKQFGIKEYKDSFVDVAVADFTRAGTIYGVPLSVDSLALFYNKDLLGSAKIATPAKTWKELQQHVKLIKKQNSVGYFTRSGVALGTNKNINRAADILNLFMLQKGAAPFSGDFSRATFADEVNKNGRQESPGLDALLFYSSFALPFTAEYNWNNASDYSIDAFASGKLAYLYSYSYTKKLLKNKAPNLNYDVAQAPQVSLDEPAVNFANYWGEVVSSQAKNKPLAWDFLKFISSKPVLDKYYAATKQPSSRKDLIELQVLDPEIGVFAASNLTAKSFYKPDQEQMDAIFGRLIDNVVLKGFAMDDALSQAQEEADLLARKLEKY